MIKLNFKHIETCNMCESHSESFKTLGIRLNTSQGFKPSKKIGVGVTVMRCSVCGLIFSNPQPLPVNFDDQYGLSVEEYWNNVDTTWDDRHFKTELNILKGLNFNFTNSKGLDIGAGYGKSMLSMENAGIEAYGFEPAKEFYKLAINKLGISELKLKLSTIEEIDYPLESFDFITFGAVLEHIHDPDFALKKAISWLKPGGFIHIEVPSAKWFIGKLYNFYYKVFCRSNFVTNISPMHSPFHHFEFTTECFKKNGAINSYEVRFSKTEVCETMMPVKFLDGVLKRWMELTGTGLQMIVFLKKI